MLIKLCKAIVDVVVVSVCFCFALCICISTVCFLLAPCVPALIATPVLFHVSKVEDCLNPRERLKVDAFRATPVKPSRIPSATYKFQASARGTKCSTNEATTVSTTMGGSTEAPMPASTLPAVAAAPPTTTTTTTFTETVDSAAEAAAELEASAAMRNEILPSLTSMSSGAADQSEGVPPRHLPARPEAGRVSPVKIAKLPHGADPDSGGIIAGAGSAARGEIGAGSGDGGDVSAPTPNDDGDDPAAPAEEILHVVLGRISLREPTLGRPSNFEREQVGSVSFAIGHEGAHWIKDRIERTGGGAGFDLLDWVW